MQMRYLLGSVQKNEGACPVVGLSGGTEYGGGAANGFGRSESGMLRFKQFIPLENVNLDGMFMLCHSLELHTFDFL